MTATIRFVILAATCTLRAAWLVPIHAAASDGEPPVMQPCARESGQLPRTVRVPPELRRHIEKMLAASATFRRPCQRITDAPWLQVHIVLDPTIADRSYRARSTIDRARSGALHARVHLLLGGNPVEWIAHEFEHLVEQLDGLDLERLAADRRGVWLSGPRMFESQRAIEAGRTVLAEMRAGQRRSDKFVE